jgi:type II secretory pathway component PulK
MRQRGVALIVALALMVILALLASSGMRMSIAELMMAGNEQFRHAASMAASSGIETAVAQLARHGSSPVSGETLDGDDYAVTIRYAGDEMNLPGSSVGKFIGHHFEITSVGRSSRLARDEQVQGVMLVSSVAAGVAAFHQSGDGLEAELAP